MKTMKNPICFALDGMGLDEAQRTIDELDGTIGAVKVGLELFVRAGRLPTTNLPIILDLKLHDIPETVAGAVKAGGDLGAEFMTMHIQQRKTIEAALRAAEPFGTTLLGVTVLTSMSHEDCNDLGFTRCPSVRVIDLADFAYGCGMTGFVCSPFEVRALRGMFDDDAFLLVPDVRSKGKDIDDQRRVGTPKDAIDGGASMIVVGRQIRSASDRRGAALDIVREIGCA